MKKKIQNKLQLSGSKIGILAFDLYEEKEGFEIAQRAQDFHSCLWDISQELRSRLKHSDLGPDQYIVVESIIGDFWDTVNKYNIDL